MAVQSDKAVGQAVVLLCHSKHSGCCSGTSGAHSAFLSSAEACPADLYCVGALASWDLPQEKSVGSCAE